MLTPLAVEFRLSVYPGAFDDEFKKRREARWGIGTPSLEPDDLASSYLSDILLGTILLDQRALQS
jgi:hypothetical protein